MKDPQTIEPLELRKGQINLYGTKYDIEYYYDDEAEDRSMRFLGIERILHNGVEITHICDLQVFEDLIKNGENSTNFKKLNYKGIELEVHWLNTDNTDIINIIHDGKDITEAFDPRQLKKLSEAGRNG